jgi:hypothetical protein
MRPTHDGLIVFKKWFSSTPDQQAEPIIKLAYKLLEDPLWRDRMTRELQRAIELCAGYEGQERQLAHARILDFKRLIRALANIKKGGSRPTDR